MKINEFMITYELAKQLKEAGFPQVGTQGYYINEADKVCFTQNCCCHDTAGIIIEYSDPEHKNISKVSKAYIAIVPTLSELIEACGDDFLSLEKTMNGRWIAYSGKQSDISYNSDNPAEIIFDKTEIKTPEEAVAKLWLKLNENK